MNEVFLTGIIIGEISFKFIIKSKNMSVARFTITTLEKQKIVLKAADFVYSKLSVNDKICVNGKIYNNEVVVENIIKSR
jgi:hypothetical protein